MADDLQAAVGPQVTLPHDNLVIPGDLREPSALAGEEGDHGDLRPVEVVEQRLAGPRVVVPAQHPARFQQVPGQHRVGQHVPGQVGAVQVDEVEAAGELAEVPAGLPDVDLHPVAVPVNVA